MSVYIPIHGRFCSWKKLAKYSGRVKRKECQEEMKCLFSIRSLSSNSHGKMVLTQIVGSVQEKICETVFFSSFHVNHLLNGGPYTGNPYHGNEDIRRKRNCFCVWGTKFNTGLGEKAPFAVTSQTLHGCSTQSIGLFEVPGASNLFHEWARKVVRCLYMTSREHTDTREV